MTARSNAVRSALKIARSLGLTRALRPISNRLPRRARLWLAHRRLDARTRAGEAHSLIAELGVLTPEAALKRVCADALRVLRERENGAALGDYLEFGVYIGTSMSCVHEVLEDAGHHEVRLFGFDSFEGLPADTETDDTSQIETWRAGDLKAPIEVAKANLTQRGVDWDRVSLVKGFFEDTLTEELKEEHGLRKASMIMVDSDLYSSAKEALAFSAPLIHDHAVILFDDWWPATLGAAHTGEKRAFAEFLADHPEFEATELESYRPEAAKVFLVSRRTPAAQAANALAARVLLPFGGCPIPETGLL